MVIKIKYHYNAYLIIFIIDWGRGRTADDRTETIRGNHRNLT